MNGFKKFLSLLLVLVICIGIIPSNAFAAANSKGVTFSASLDKDIIETSDTAQTVVMTVKANKAFPIDAIGWTTMIPEGWIFKSIRNDELGFTENDVNLENGRTNYATPDAENWSTDLVTVVTYIVPANVAAGTYELGIKDLVISEDFGTVWEDVGAASVTLTIKGTAHVCSGTEVPGQASTHNADGWKDYYSCSCGKNYSDSACSDEIDNLEEWKISDGKIKAGHNHVQIWKSDDNNHWKECEECGEKSDIAAHDDSDKDGKCDACNDIIASSTDSSSTNDSSIGSLDAEELSSDNLQTDGNHIIWLGVIVLCVIVCSVAAILLRKKRRIK